MKQEDKDILFKDVCARIPYNLCMEHNNTTYQLVNCSTEWVNLSRKNSPYSFALDWTSVKPYLFPLTSMTKEQKKEINKRYINSIDDYSISIKYHSDGYWDDDTDAGFSDYLWLINWFNKNHFDYQGLIKKGLAIDATNLNIY